MHWSCTRPDAPRDIDNTGNHHVRGYFTELHSGSSERCIVTGHANPDDRLDYHCYARDIDGVHKWTYVVVVQTRAKGWIDNRNLRDGGSRQKCPGQTDPS